MLKLSNEKAPDVLKSGAFSSLAYLRSETLRDAVYISTDEFREERFFHLFGGHFFYALTQATQHSSFECFGRAPDSVGDRQKLCVVHTFSVYVGTLISNQRPFMAATKPGSFSACSCKRICREWSKLKSESERP